MGKKNMADKYTSTLYTYFDTIVLVLKFTKQLLL